MKEKDFGKETSEMQSGSQKETELLQGLDLHHEYVNPAIFSHELESVARPQVHEGLQPKEGDDEQMSRLKEWTANDAHEIARAKLAVEELQKQLLAGEHPVQKDPAKTGDVEDLKVYVDKEVERWGRALEIMTDSNAWELACKPHYETEVLERKLQDERERLNTLCREQKQQLQQIRSDIDGLETDPQKRKQYLEKIQQESVLSDSYQRTLDDASDTIDQLRSVLESYETLPAVNGRALNVYKIQQGLDVKVDFPKEYQDK